MNQGKVLVLVCLGVVVTTALPSPAEPPSAVKLEQTVLKHVPADCEGFVMIKNVEQTATQIARLAETIGEARDALRTPKAIMDAIRARLRKTWGGADRVNLQGGWAVALLPRPVKRPGPGPVTTDDVLAEVLALPWVMLIPGTAPQKMFSACSPSKAGPYVQISLDGKKHFCCEISGYVLLSREKALLARMAKGGQSILKGLSKKDADLIARSDLTVWASGEAIKTVMEPLQRLLRPGRGLPDLPWAMLPGGASLEERPVWGPTSTMVPWSQVSLTGGESLGWEPADYALEADAPALDTVAARFFQFPPPADEAPADEPGKRSRTASLWVHYGVRSSVLSDLSVGVQLLPKGVVLESRGTAAGGSPHEKTLKAYRPARGLRLDRLPDGPFILALGLKRGSPALRAALRDLPARLTVQYSDTRISEGIQAHFRKLAEVADEQITELQAFLGRAGKGSKQVGLALVIGCKSPPKLRAALRDFAAGMGSEPDRARTLWRQTLFAFRIDREAWGRGKEKMDVFALRVGKIHPDEKTRRILAAVLGEDKLRLRVAQADAKTLVATLGGGESFLARAVSAARTRSGKLEQHAAIAAVLTRPDERPVAAAFWNLKNAVEAVGAGAAAAGDPLPLKLTSDAPIAYVVSVDGADVHTEVRIPTKPTAELVRSWLEMRRARKYAGMSPLNKAIVDATRVIERDPDRAEAYRKRADAQLRKGCYGEAVTDYSKAIGLEPASARSYRGRGIAWGKQGRLDKAISDLTKAVELDPDNPEGYLRRAKAYAHRGRHDPARADAKKCQALGGKPDPRFLARLGRGQVGWLIRVNDRFITVDELLGRLGGQLATTMLRAGTEAEFRRRSWEIVAAEARNRILQALVLTDAENRLSAKQARLVQSALDDRLKEMLDEAGGSLKELQESCLRRGRPLDEVLADFRGEQTCRAYLRSKFLPALAIDEERLRRYYRSHIRDFHKGKKVQMQIIAAPFKAFLPGGTPRPTASQRKAARVEAKALIGRAADEITAGRDFADVARRLSKGLRARHGGLWPPMGKGDFSEARVEAAAFRLAEGGVAGPIETDTGFYLVKAKAVQPAETIPFERAEKRIGKLLREQRYRELSEEYIRKLLKAARVQDSPAGRTAILDLAVDRYWGKP